MYGAEQRDRIPRPECTGTAEPEHREGRTCANRHIEGKSEERKTMANIFDYLDWRGDIPFSVDPFNEVDNLILSEIAYSDLDGVVPSPGHGSIAASRAASKYFCLHTEKEILARNTYTKTAPLLLKKAAATKRFAHLRLSSYINVRDENNAQQLSAVLFSVGDGTLYGAFRGTDDSLTGWKEDLNLSYSRQTPGQAGAVMWVNRNLMDLPAPEAADGMRGGIRLGGHSKGGNFAVYAAAFCDPAIQEHIVEIYSNDGPGFVEVLTESEEYRKILPRIRKIIPEDDMIGLCMTSGNVCEKVIRSDKSGAEQHDALSWQVVGNHFVEAESRSGRSTMFEQTLRMWLNGISGEARKNFIDTLFDVLSADGKTRMSEVTDDRLATLAAGLKVLSTYPKEQQKQFWDILLKLADSTQKAYFDTAASATAELLNRYSDGGLGALSSYLHEQTDKWKNSLQESIRTIRQSWQEKTDNAKLSAERIPAGRLPEAEQKRNLRAGILNVSVSPENPGLLESAGLRAAGAGAEFFRTGEKGGRAAAEEKKTEAAAESGETPPENLAGKADLAERTDLAEKADPAGRTDLAGKTGPAEKADPAGQPGSGITVLQAMKESVRETRDFLKGAMENLQKGSSAAEPNRPDRTPEKT